MMQGTAPAKAAAPAKTVFKEAPPKFRSGRHTAVVKEVFDITPKFPETYLIRFTFENEPIFDFEPGQFISIFAEKEGKKISRPYSIASWPGNKDYLELCIKVVEGGFMSNYLHYVPVGMKLASVAPLGRFVLAKPLEQDIMFVATGTGVAPFISHLGHLFADHLDEDREIDLIFGTRYSYELIYHDLILKWEEQHPNFHYYPTVSRPETPEWKGRVGYVQKIIQNEISHPERKQVMICGLHDMVEQVSALCRDMGFPLVRFEKWD